MTIKVICLNSTVSGAECPSEGMPVQTRLNYFLQDKAQVERAQLKDSQIKGKNLQFFTISTLIKNNSCHTCLVAD